MRRPHIRWGLDAHQTLIDQLLDEVEIEFLRFIHLADERRDLLAGEAANGILEELLLFTESAERKMESRFYGFKRGHGVS